ncbi:MAG: cupredoxin domain-containing protein [Firmicutes bacterium]|nr:cupredoxin domain-containing protein [Bacillota bacterium]
MVPRGLVAGLGTFLAVLTTATAVRLVIQEARPPGSTAAPTLPEIRQVALYLHPFEFGDQPVHHWIPPIVVVNAGDTVILRVTNADPKAVHGFALGGFNIAIPAIAPGQTVTMRFQARRPGVYHFGCAATGCAVDHADQVGQLVVLGNAVR